MRRWWRYVVIKKKLSLYNDFPIFKFFKKLNIKNQLLMTTLNTKTIQIQNAYMYKNYRTLCSKSAKFKKTSKVTSLNRWNLKKKIQSNGVPNVYKFLW